MSHPRAQDLRFIDHLEEYVPRDPPEGGTREGGNRVALAALRRGLGKDIGDAPEMYPYVVLALGGIDERQERAFYLVASLFALHPSIWSQDLDRRENMGASLLRLARKLESEDNSSEGVERRFVALLNASQQDLPEHLRHAVSLLKSKEVSVDWAQLLRDVQDWHWPDHPVQRSWARAFWIGPAPETAAATDTTANEATPAPGNS